MFCPNCEKEDCICVLGEANKNMYELYDTGVFLPYNPEEWYDVELKIKLLHDDSQVPKKAHSGDTCFDVFAYIGHEVDEDNVVLPLHLMILPGQTSLVQTGISLAVPEGWEIQVRPRSGLALKKSIAVLNSPGSVDSNYRGEVGVILINHGSEPFIVSHGDKIAQIKVSKVPKVKVSVVENLDETERGSGGYGSTGI